MINIVATTIKNYLSVFILIVHQTQEFQFFFFLFFFDFPIGCEFEFCSYYYACKAFYCASEGGSICGLYDLTGTYGEVRITG